MYVFVRKAREENSGGGGEAKDHHLYGSSISLSASLTTSWPSPRKQGHCSYEHTRQLQMSV